MSDSVRRRALVATWCQRDGVTIPASISVRRTRLHDDARAVEVVVDGKDQGAVSLSLDEDEARSLAEQLEARADQ